MAAAIFVLFGDPGFLTDPDPVPTLRYVWTSNAHKVGDLIPNPYMPATVRNIVVRAGSEKLSQWTVERRSLADDFQRAFGKPPEENVSAIALFADNDQTGEPFESYFKAISVDCGTSS